ncbi:MAG: hypothetical protein KKH04_15425 [Proteobacteria bacterium]|nr:hypothetical protein [Pseudomonadota bacterium]
MQKVAAHEVVEQFFRVRVFQDVVQLFGRRGGLRRFLVGGRAWSGKRPGRRRRFA